MTKIKLDIEENWELPLSQMITYRLSRVHSKVSAQASRILRKNSKLSLMQWRVFVSIIAIEKATHSKIIAKTGLDGGQLSRCVRTMIATGLLEAKTHDADSRQQYLSITQKGRQVYKEARPYMRRRQSKFIKALSAEEHEVLSRILSKLEKVTESEKFLI
jgi:DNA-binding MarR family transcriptional regulator|tara:strand:+ start:590 stop:1069 length:480 start_codon:yes stop_codon:yes gene_type:complete